MTQMNSSVKQKQTHGHRKQTCDCQRWGRGGVQGRKGWIGSWGLASIYKLLHVEWINNKVQLFSTGNYIQCPVINHHGKEYEKYNIIYIYIYI